MGGAQVSQPVEPPCYILRQSLLDDLQHFGLHRASYQALVNNECSTMLLEQIRNGIYNDAKGTPPVIICKLFAMTEHACRHCVFHRKQKSFAQA